jgi:hypothetical protein
MKRLLHALLVVSVVSVFFLPPRANAFPGDDGFRDRGDPRGDRGLGDPGAFGRGRGFGPGRGFGRGCGPEVSGALCRDIRTDLRDIFQDERELAFLLRDPEVNAAEIEADLAKLQTAILDLDEAIASASV